jgi:membrane protease YdiL (CAAX protease family)
MGVIFGSIYIYTKDIKISMLIHFINNGMAAVSLLIMNKSFNIPNVGIEIPYEAFLSIFLLLFILIGSILGIRFICKLTKDKKWNRLPFLQKNNEQAVKNRHLFLLYDYMFDFSIIALLVMSIMTESILKAQ